jgi:outer membrane receptor for ferric coprogen and ferric-rhodotorulic acid
MVTGVGEAKALGPRAPSMADRLMRVNAYTTLDLVDATVRGQDFEADSYAVVNATSPREAPDRVQLQIELDNMAEDHVPAHMEELSLDPEQARELAAELEQHADSVEQAQEAE